MTARSDWDGVIEIEQEDAGAADRLTAALRPEASREVPRATARVERVGPAGVRISLTARDTGALRAALNTYLGWISLADRTEEVGRDALAPRPDRR